ncbi:MAG: dehydrogenase, partial [Verrucomicrobia bacterium]
MNRQKYQRRLTSAATVSGLLLCAGVALAAAPEGMLPTGKDGRPLNLDFEDGSLKDWVAVGPAFEKQPIRGDTVAARRGDMRSDHRGNYWIGTYEISGDGPQGTLTSAPFKITQPYAGFLVGGGAQANTRVELVRADTQQVIFKASGYDGENLRPVVADLRAHQGKEIFIRVIDQESGGWGHINFDDFRLYAQRPKFANQLDPAKDAQAGDLPPMDAVKFAGLSPEQAAKEMTLPPGFKATLFAGEPHVKQPIAFAIDDRGRLWVAEAYTYPIRAPEGQGKDRILVFEDTDGDGKFNRRTVFMEGLNLVSGLEIGFGGVWVGAAPDLMFIPVKDGDEPKPAGPPQILLDGWAYQDTHETLNTFTWGPDGWLYGCHGVFTHSNVGKPGAPDNERTRINAGVWRYHPTKHRFEVFAEGTSNPWGIDFDEHGQCFIEACVIPHLFHVIQAARYTRQ